MWTQASPAGAFLSRRSSPSSSTGSSDLRKSRDNLATHASPGAVVTQPTPTSSKQDPPSSPPRDDFGPEQNQQAGKEPNSRKEVSPPPGFDHQRAPAKPSAQDASGGHTLGRVLETQRDKAKALQATAAAFDPTAGAGWPQEPGRTQTQSPCDSQQGKTLPELQQGSALVDGVQPNQPNEEAQAGRRSRTGQKSLRPTAEAVPLPQQSSGDEAVQMARSLREGSRAQDEDLQAAWAVAGLRGGVPGPHPEEEEDVHMLGTTPPSSSGMQHLSAAAPAAAHAPSSSAQQVEKPPPLRKQYFTNVVPIGWSST